METNAEVGQVSAYYISTAARVVSSRSLVLKQTDCLAVFDDFGNAQAHGPAAEGLFFEDTRYLAKLALTIDGVAPLLLSSGATSDNTMLEIDLTNPDLMEAGRLRLARNTVHILRTVVLGENALFETFEARNYGHVPTRFGLELAFDADFADMFELRGSVRPRRGTFLPDEARENGLTIAYCGLDELVRRSRITFDPPPQTTAHRRATWEIELQAGARRTIRLAVYCECDSRPRRETSREASVALAARQLDDRKTRAADVETSNELFNDWLHRSRADLDMLVTETPQGLYAYAGIPWFSTAFGRDGLITALECLWLDPALAAGTLRFLAFNQATVVDAKADAEPGKILHETRKGEMASLGEVPFGRYYGSIDATPLFVVLAAAYHARTGDLALIRTLWPNIEAALAWMTRYGDLDDDGLIEYDRKSVNGLVNQGWKDSSDSIFHADGNLAEAPIALAEVQAYAYAAYVGASILAGLLGRTERSAALADAARRLEQRFEAAFWLEDLGTYALALDGEKRPCRVRSSNAGQVLFGGLASPRRAARVADTLMARDSYSRWGIRTVAEAEARYNPMSYHNGSVWPHDNALIVMGMARYGLKEPALRILTGLFDAARSLEMQRLPELFCGFARRQGVPPTAYPVACNPQAWASASVFAMLGAALGISFDRPSRQIRFTNPALPPWLAELRLSNLRLGEATVDLIVERSDKSATIRVVRGDGSIEIVLTA